ncbi:MAG: hypothetical protein RI907_3487 [Pseudomonadota bacterium]|jgi:murein DD-endopeptidase MepM/ murein hydrolase activator NlpD
MVWHRRAPLRLSHFPVEVTPATSVSFHDGFLDPRPEGTHLAIDISAPEGTWVRAAVGGTVLRRWVSGRGPVPGVGWTDRGGYIATLLDAEGYVHYYAHMLDEPRLRPGQLIRAGERIGQVSNTGRHGPMHLHYQVWPVGQDRDEEVAELTFHMRFAPAVNPYDELRRLAGTMGASLGRGVQFHATTCAEGPTLASPGA